MAWTPVHKDTLKKSPAPAWTHGWKGGDGPCWRGTDAPGWRGGNGPGWKGDAGWKNPGQGNGGGWKGSSWGPSNVHKVPGDFQIDKNARYQGKVTSYVKFSGYGWAEMIQKGVVPGDKVYVFWKSITTDDRFPQLQPEMLIEFGLHLTPAGGGSYQLRAKNVTLPGGLPICIQDDADSAKKVFVGGQHIRYTGKLRYYSTKWGGSGKVVLDDGYAFDEAVPKELVVELPEVNCGGKAPFDMKDLEVEFGIWKTQKGLYKVYNMTLPGGAPFSKEAIEHRQVVPGRVFRGKVKKNMWQQGWGLVAVDPGAALPPDVIPKVKTSKDSEAGEVLLYFREADVKDGQWLKTGQDVLFSVYVDDKGAGACDLHAAELPPKTGLA